MSDPFARGDCKPAIICQRVAFPLCGMKCPGGIDDLKADSNRGGGGKTRASFSISYPPLSTYLPKYRVPNFFAALEISRRF